MLTRISAAFSVFLLHGLFAAPPEVGTDGAARRAARE
jgi:hypothetical protein